jgi:dTDP-4-amino-4,6-dideoxygalactose transaminase
MVFWLRKNGVGACKWPWREIPSEVAANPLKYPISNQLNRRLVLLPVHQSIGPRQIKYISSVLKSYVEKI